MVTEYTLTLNPDTDNYQYIISQIQSIDTREEKPATSITPPGQDYKNNILMGMSGQTMNITINHRIHNGNNSSNEAVDKANGTYTSTVVTIDEQIEYLQDVIHDASFDAEWELTGGRFTNLPVYVENVDVSIEERTSPRWRSCRIELITGEAI